MEIGDTYMYIYKRVWHVRPHFSSPVAQLRTMGGVYSQPLCCNQ